MPISMTFNRIFPDLQDQQVQISKTFQIFKAPYEPCLSDEEWNRIRIRPRTWRGDMLSIIAAEPLRQLYISQRACGPQS
jgi:hypothetical protein